MSVDIAMLKGEYEALRADRAANEEVVWDEIEKLIMPLTGRVAAALDGSSAEQKTDLCLWDLNAPLAAEHLASSLHGNVTPSAEWVDFQWLDEEVEADHEAVKHREKLAAIVGAELEASDFGMEMASAYLEWAVKGNTCLVSETLKKRSVLYAGLDFTAVPVAEVQFVEDSRGGVLRWYRALRWTPVQMRAHCLREDADVPERIEEACKKDNAATEGAKELVIFAIYRRDGLMGTEEIEERVEGDAIPAKRPFGCAYFTLEHQEQLGQEDGYYKMPAVMGRFGKRAGSSWGFGRGNVALRAVKWLNAAKELQRNAFEKAVDPAMGQTERVGQAIDHRPGAVNVMPSKDDAWPIESAARFDVSAEVLRDERAEIRRAFHEDDLQLKESPQMTATEVQARQDQMNRALGSPVARLTSEVLSPIVLIVLDHLSRARRLPPAPEIVKRKKPELKLVLRGPIARALAMDKVVSIERAAGFIANLVKLGFPEARHRLDLDGMLREYRKLLGAPAAMFRSPAEAKRREDEERAAAARAQAAEAMKNTGQGMAAAASAGLTAPGIGEAPALLPSGGIAA
jgi:hypothetical protein